MQEATFLKKNLSRTAPDDPLKEASLIALSQMLDPVLRLTLETGVTVREITQMVRGKAVNCADEYIRDVAGPRNQSRIAILTGLPRSEVARALNQKNANHIEMRSRHPRDRVMSGWFDDSTFLNKCGDPAILPIYGRRKSLDALIRKYVGGIPTRAMLDELVRVGAIEQLEGQKVRALRRFANSKTRSARALATVGERARDLLSTLLRNAINDESRLFDASAIIENVSLEGHAVIRREIHLQGDLFIRGVEDLFRQLENSRLAATAGRQVGTVSRVGVTVVYFEEDNILKHKENAPTGRRRTNLRRTRPVID